MMCDVMPTISEVRFKVQNAAKLFSKQQDGNAADERRRVHVAQAQAMLRDTDMLDNNNENGVNNVGNMNASPLDDRNDEDDIRVEGKSNKQGLFLSIASV